MSYLLSSSVVVDFGHGAEGRPEFVHGWSGWMSLTRQRTLYDTYRKKSRVSRDNRNDTILQGQMSFQGEKPRPKSCD